MVSLYETADSEGFCQYQLKPEIMKLPLIRLSTDEHVVIPSKQSPPLYIPTNNTRDRRFVKHAIAVESKPGERRGSARNFLNRIGVRLPDSVDVQIFDFCVKYSAATGSDIAWGEHLGDLRLLVRSLKKASEGQLQRAKQQLAELCFLRAKASLNEWNEEILECPVNAYFFSPEIRAFFSGCPGKSVLLEEYRLENDWSELKSQLEKLGVMAVPRQVEFHKSTEDVEVSKPLKASAGNPHKRGIGGFHPEWTMDGLEHAVKHPTLERIVVLWNVYLKNSTHSIRGAVQSGTREDAVFGKKRHEYQPKDSDMILSKGGRILFENRWIPDLKCEWNRSSEVTASTLHDRLNKKVKILEALGNMASGDISIDKTEEAALQLLSRKRGIDPELLAFAIDHPDVLQHAVEEFRKLSSQKFNNSRKLTPDDELQIQARIRNSKPFEVDEFDGKRRRKECLKSDLVWLRELYKDTNGAFHCQLCKRILPSSPKRLGNEAQGDPIWVQTCKRRREIVALGGRKVQRPA